MVGLSPCCRRPAERLAGGGGGTTGRRRRGGEGARLVVTGVSVTPAGDDDDDVAAAAQYAASRAEMDDVALLRERYRWSKEDRMRRDQVVVFRRVSEDLTEAVRVMPVVQGLSFSYGETDPSGPLDLTLLPVDPTLRTPDPWHVHLDLHRRINGPAGIAVTLTPPATPGSHSPPLPRRHSSLSETGSFRPKHRVGRYSVDSAAGLNGGRPGASTEDPTPGYASDAEAHHHPDGFLKIPPWGAGACGSSFSSTSGDRSVGSSASGDSAAGSLTSFDDDSDTPVGSSRAPSTRAPSTRTPSPPSSVADPNDIGERHGGHGPACGASGTLAGQQRFGVQQHPSTALAAGHRHPNSYYPFPNRKSIKKSEAAKKLGMYS